MLTHMRLFWIIILFSTVKAYAITYTPLRLFDLFPVESPPSEGNRSLPRTTECPNTSETPTMEMLTNSLGNAQNSVASFFKSTAENVDETMKYVYHKARELFGWGDEEERRRGSMRNSSSSPADLRTEGNGTIQIFEQTDVGKVVVETMDAKDEPDNPDDIVVVVLEGQARDSERKPKGFLEKEKQLQKQLEEFAVTLEE